MSTSSSPIPPLPLPKKKKKVSSQSHRLPHRTLKRQNSNFLPIPHFFLCKNILLQNIFDFFGRVGPREEDGAGHVERFLDATCTTATADDGFAEIGTAPEEEVRRVVGEFGEMAAGGFDEREILFFWVRGLMVMDVALLFCRGSRCVWRCCLNLRSMLESALQSPFVIR